LFSWLGLPHVTAGAEVVFFPSPHECLTAGERVTENILNLYQLHPSYIEIGPFKVCVYRYSQNPF
jgi:hypothetical protein